MRFEHLVVVVKDFSGFRVNDDYTTSRTTTTMTGATRRVITSKFFISQSIRSFSSGSGTTSNTEGNGCRVVVEAKNQSQIIRIFIRGTRVITRTTVVIVVIFPVSCRMYLYVLLLFIIISCCCYFTINNSPEKKVLLSRINKTSKP
jgi:hypothetical protein